MRTIWPKREEIDSKWLLVDAKDQTVGRLSSEVAKLIRGKHKTCYTPNLDCGDHVVVINAEKINFTGNKMTDKKYFSYSNYPGGQKVATPQLMLQKYPERIIEKAVRGMLPKNRLGRKLFKKLHVQVGEHHTFEAQKPVKFDL